MKSAKGLLQLMLAITCGFALSACQTVQPPAWDLPPGVKTLTANGYPMAYLERGSGPTLVLVPGSLNDYRYWLPQIESLSSRFRVVSVSPRHFYPEPWKGKGDFSIKLHSEDLAAFIEGLNAGPVHVVGWSRGGTVAVGMAHARPDLVRKLVLSDPALFSLLPSQPSVDPRVTRARATQVYFDKGDMEGGMEFFFDDSNGKGAWQRLPEQQRQFRRQNAWTIIGQLGDAESVGCAELGRLTMPVLLMTGEQSPASFKNMREAAHKCLPSSRMVTIPKAAHQMSQNNPPAFDAELTRFLLD